jgi:hypothetical protein
MNRNRMCVLSLGIDGVIPSNHPRVMYQDFGRGIERIRRLVEEFAFPGDFIAWDKEYPEGSPKQADAHGAFKPFCFREAQNRGYELVLWLDASIRIKRPMDQLFDLLTEEHYLMFHDDTSVGEYCKDEALVPLGISREESFNLPSCWTCAIGLDLTHVRSREFLDEWLERARDGVTFPGPKWSGVRGWPLTASADPRVKGHRYDQTAASAIAHRLGMTEWKSKQMFGEFFQNEWGFVRLLHEEYERDENSRRSYPTVEIQGMDGFADRMIQYMVARWLARRIAIEVGGCRVSNVVLPEWGINHPAVSSPPGSKVDIFENRVDVEGIARLLAAGEKTGVSLKSSAQWFSNFPDLDFCRGIFKANERDYPGYGLDCLVCHLRGADTFDGRQLHNTLLPIEFYADLVRTTGLKPVFIGQVEDNAYCDALRRQFPDAEFCRMANEFAEFQTFRNSKNLVPAVSTFSWLAAWLSRAQMILLSVNGLFHPVQVPEIDLLPYMDKRYRFYLFPINYAAPVERMEQTHQALLGCWRYMRPEAIAQLRRSTPRWPKRLDRFISVFDAKFYLEANPDLATEVAAGDVTDVLGHYQMQGFKEGRLGFAFDDRWYSTEYPFAAFEVGQGDYADLKHHFVEVGAMRGYKPIPPG